jgi:hypothetical protein
MEAFLGIDLYDWYYQFYSNYEYNYPLHDVYVNAIIALADTTNSDYSSERSESYEYSDS